MGIFWDTWKVVLEKYVDRNDLDTQEIIIGATRGIINALKDPYSEFLDSEQTKDLSQELSGEFYGVGMEIGKRDGFLAVIAPLPGTPAEEAGLKANDKIIKIDNTETIDLSPFEAAKLIRGPEGTKVILTIYRPNWDETKKIELTRKKISIPSVRWEKIDNNIAYLKIYNFNQPLTLNFYKTALEIAFTKPQGLIIDLRNNPGGYLESVIDISGWFLEKGNIILKEDFGNDEIKIFRVRTGQALLKDIPTVILINEGTASASEILAGALRDNRGVKLIGEKSFGKGSVQELVSLKDNNSVKITISRWLTPNETIIEGNGLVPDIEVKNEEEFGTFSKIDLEKDRQLQVAVAELQKLLINN
jgi:carboxyl-terminal processing protease